MNRFSPYLPPRAASAASAGRVEDLSLAAKSKTASAPIVGNAAKLTLPTRQVPSSYRAPTDSLSRLPSNIHREIARHLPDKGSVAMFAKALPPAQGDGLHDLAKQSEHRMDIAASARSLADLRSVLVGPCHLTGLARVGQFAVATRAELIRVAMNRIAQLPNHELRAALKLCLRACDDNADAVAADARLRNCRLALERADNLHAETKSAKVRASLVKNLRIARLTPVGKA